MAAAVHEMDFNKETEYNGKLYKAILNPFINFMPAVQLSECDCISRLLTLEEMERVKRRLETDGQNSAARLLLDFLKMKLNWFDAFMEALDSPHLKLQEHKIKFLKERDRVDEEWQRTHPPGSATQATRQLSRPVQSTMGQDSAVLRAPVPASSDGGNMPPSDFNVIETDLQVSNMEGRNGRLEKDAVEEQEEDRPKSMADLQNGMANMVVEQERPLHHSKSYPGTSQADAGAAEGSPDAAPNEYDIPGAPSLPSDYDQLNQNGRSLETDACPEAVQPSGIPEQEVGEEALPHVRGQQRPRPQTRQDHPSLRVAISNNPRKDFEADFVSNELSNLRGWKNFREEQQVIQLIRPNRRMEGLYVIWYWALAKRPTICVVLRGKVITFVVHRSASRPNKFYINRQQKRCTSLKELVSYHLQTGISYRPPGENEMTVWLTTPAN